MAGALIVAAGFGGGAAYAATELAHSGSGPSGGSGAAMSSTMQGNSMMGDSMMGGAGPRASGMATGMGKFTTTSPFDVQFIDQMSTHHQGAIASTQAMIADSRRPELRTLAHDIITTQRAQLTQMAAWRAQWYPGVKSTFAMTGSMMGNTAGDTMMGSGTMMAGATMTGPGTERMYLQMMIVHHQLAVDMANQALRRATHPQLKALAATIAREQSTQITQMRAYLAATPH